MTDVDGSGSVPGSGEPERAHVPPIPPPVEHDLDTMPAPTPAAPAKPAESPYAALADSPSLSARSEAEELGTPQMQPIPKGRHWPLIAAIVVVAVLVLAGGAWAVWHASGGTGTAGPLPGTPPPGSAGSTSAPSATATASAGATGSAAATGTGGGSGSAGATGSAGQAGVNPSPALARARLIAYRKDAALWVADDTGGDRRRVGTSAEGAFSLSPDGTRLAVVDPEADVLSILDVETGRKRTVGTAENREPSWAPDGAWLAYTGLRKGSRVVVRVGRDGSAQTTMAVGFAPQVSSDGASIYYLQTGQDVGGPIARMDATVSGRPVTVVVPDAVTAFALSGTDLVYATGTGASAAIMRAGTDGAAATRLVGAPKDTSASGYADLMLSPDSRTLLYARTGDDGYSRIAVVPLSGGSALDLSSRTDDYPMGWTVDGARIVLVTGNSFQGEKTDVVSVKPNGTSRIVLVPGGDF